MELLSVIGNISRDLIVYPGTRTEMLGGAALHIALAASRAGLRAAPVAVLGTDLGWIMPSHCQDVWIGSVVTAGCRS